MYCIRKVNDDYTWVGADCRRLALFEGVFGVPDGVSFNSYLLMDDKTVLFDTVDSAVRTTFRETVAHVLNGKAPDYLVVHHMEPDHAAEMADLARQYPDMAILCSAAAMNMIAQFFDAELAGRVTVVKEGDTLCTGRHTLRFIAAPMVHWPEVLMTYDETDKLLLTADDIADPVRHENFRNTIQRLLELDAIPIVNENDTVSVAEFGIGDNDTLSSIVATSVHADLLVLQSDIDGLYTADPHKNPDAARIELVPEITEEILRLADGKGSELGTGGMKTKLTAAQIVTKAGTDMIIANGAEVEKLYALLDGKSIGTRFLGKKADI